MSAAAEYIENVLGVALTPWQRGALARLESEPHVLVPRSLLKDLIEGASGLDGASDAVLTAARVRQPLDRQLTSGYSSCVRGDGPRRNSRREHA